MKNSSIQHQRESYNEFLCTYHLAPQLSTHSQKPGVSKHLCNIENDVIYLNLINLACFVFPLCLQMIGFPSELCKFIYYHIFKYKLEHSKGKYVVFINFYLLNLKIVVKYIYHGVTLTLQMHSSVMSSRLHCCVTPLLKCTQVYVTSSHFYPLDLIVTGISCHGRIKQYFSFNDWFLSFCIMFSRLIYYFCKF